MCLKVRYSGCWANKPANTTLEIIETLREKTGGEIIVDGMNLDTDAAAIKKIIGVQLQTSGFILA